jgi:FkbM family methyltransferase
MARNLRMLCFEPNPAAFACLTTNVDARGMEAKCLPFGLSSENKSADLTFFDGMSLLSGFFAAASTEREVVKRYLSNLHPELLDGKQLPAEIGEMVDDRFRSRTMSVPVRTLSSVIAEERIDRINLLKINVEKSELDVLNGIGPADWPKIRQLVIEVDRQENLHPMTSLLEENGFVCVVEQDPLLRETDLCYVYAVRSPADKDELKREPSLSPVACSPSTPERELLTPALLRRQLKERLPHYMVPSAFVLMEQFPLTSNGKIDRQALPASFRSSVPPSCHGATPETETERALATIWTRLLKIETIGTGDDLFDLGAHSLLAMRAVTQIRETFGVNLHLRSLFEHPTIAGLAALIDDLSLLAPVTSGDTQDREEISF